MASQSRAAAVTAVLEYYRIKYPTWEARVDALRAAYVQAYEAVSVGKTLASSSTDGVSTSWAVSMSEEEKLAAMAEALQRLEGRQTSKTQGRII